MKTISLRTFRDSVQSLTEPVEVVKREDGEFRTLGTWSPTIIHTDKGECWCADCTAKELRLQPLPSFGAPRPAPKPSKRGSK